MNFLKNLLEMISKRLVKKIKRIKMTFLADRLMEMLIRRIITPMKNINNKYINNIQ